MGNYAKQAASCWRSPLAGKRECDRYVVDMSGSKPQSQHQGACLLPHAQVGQMNRPRNELYALAVWTLWL